MTREVYCCGEGKRWEETTGEHRDGHSGDCIPLIMCIGCGHFDTDPEAKRFCDAGCDGCSHSFEPFVDEPAPTKGEQMLALLHELGVEDLELPMICRPSGKYIKGNSHGT